MMGIIWRKGSAPRRFSHRFHPAKTVRIAVIYEGKIIGVVTRGQATVEQIGLMMAGISMKDAMQ